MTRQEKRKRLSLYRRYCDRVQDLAERIEQAKASAERVTPSQGAPGGSLSASKVETGVLSMLEAAGELETLERLKQEEADHLREITSGIKYGSMLIEYYLNRRTVPEIASKYKISVSAVEKRLRKAIDRININ